MIIPDIITDANIMKETVLRTVSCATISAIVSRRQGHSPFPLYISFDLSICGWTRVLLCTSVFEKIATYLVQSQLLATIDGNQPQNRQTEATITELANSSAKIIWPDNKL